MYSRIDHQETPDVDLMLSVIAETSHGIRATCASTPKLASVAPTAAM